MNRRTFIGYAALPLVAGCQTMTAEQKIAIAEGLARTAANTGTAVFLSSNGTPENVAAFKAVLEALAVLVDSGNSSTVLLQEALSKLPIGKLDSLTSSLIWANGVQVWNLASILLNIRSNAAAFAITNAVREGMADALEAYTATNPDTKAMVKAAKPAKPIPAPKNVRKVNI